MRKPLITTLAAAVLFCWQASTSQAQFVPATTPDQTIAVPGSAPNVVVTNTSAAEIPVGGTPLQVIVWDGTSPGFGWDYGGTTGTAPIGVGAIGSPSRPDIVTDPSATPGNEKVLVVYHTGSNRMYFEVHQWVSGTFVNVVPATLISGGPGSVITYPNVDVSFGGRAIVTWSEDGRVYGRGFVFPTNTMSTANFIASSLSGSSSCDRSDVAVFRPATGGHRVNFVFVAKFGTTARLMVQRATFSQVFSGSPATPGLGWTNFLDGVNLSAQQFGIPRIACPNRFISFMNVLDVSVVCLKYSNSGSSYEMLNYTHHFFAYGANVFATNSLNTAPMDISNCGNKYSSISYVGRFIIAAWTHWDCNASSNLDNLDVVARQMNLGGVPWSIFNTYSIVNQGITGSQIFPAIDGKYSSAYRGYYSWSDFTNSSVEYKSSYFYNQSLREETEAVAELPNVSTSEFKAFPNPMTDNVVFQFDLADSEQGESLEIYDLSGRLIDRLPLTGLSSNNNRVEWTATSDMPAGVYLVRLLTDQRAESIRITKQ